jgi:hypothetical protein
MNESESMDPLFIATEFLDQYQDGEKCINMTRSDVQKRITFG